MATNWTKLYQVFEMGPLEANQIHDLYVDLAAVRGEDEPGAVAAYLESSVRLASGHTCQLVSGHQGSGKSTELRRLQKQLQSGSERYFCVICDIEGELALDDTDFPDLLLAMMRATADALRRDLGIELKPGYFATRAGEIKALALSEVELKELSLDAMLGTIVATLKGSPESRSTIRKALEPKVDSLLHAANELFDEARGSLKQRGFKDLVLIVDGSDKLKLASSAKSGEYPGERLFVNRVDQTRGFAAHVVYAIPMALAFSVLVEELSSLYQQHTPIVPVTKLLDRQGKRVEAAYQRFREIVDKRLAFAGANFGEVFADEAVCEELIRLSAGQPRVLCALIRDCLRGLKQFDKVTVKTVARRETMAMRRALELPHWLLIKEFAEGKQPIPDSKNRGAFRDLIGLRGLLHYRNDKEWLAVNPLIGELPEGLSTQNA